MPLNLKTICIPIKLQHRNHPFKHSIKPRPKNFVKCIRDHITYLQEFLQNGQLDCYETYLNKCLAQICSENKYVSRSEISLFFWWNGTKDIDIRSFAEFYEKFDKYDSLMLKLDDVGELFFGSGLLDESKENEVLLKSLFKPQIMLPLGNVLNSNLRKNQLKFTNFSNFLIKTEAEMLSRVKKFVHERVNQMKRKKIGVLITPEIQEAIDTLKTKLPLSADLINSFMSTYAKNWSEGELKALTWIGLLTYDQISDWYYNKSPIDNSQLNENSLVFFIDYLCDLQKNKTDVYYHKKVINEDLKHQNKQNMKLFIDFKKHFNLLKVHLTHEEINSLKILSNLNDEFISNQDFNQMVTTENYFSLRTDSPNALFQLDKLIIFLKHKLELKLHDILFSNEQDDEFEVIKELIEERTINIGKLVRMFRLGLLNDEKIDKLKQMNILNKLGSFDMNLFKIKFMKSIENLSSGTSFITNLVKNSWLKFGYISFNLQKELLDKAQEELFNSHRDNIILDTQIIEDIKYFMAENESGLEFDMRLIDCYKPRCPREKVKVVGMSLRDFETIFNSQINEITKLNLLMNHLFFKENIDLDTFIKGLNKFELTNLNDIHLEHLIKKKIITKDLSIEYMCHVDNLKRCELANEQPSENFIDKLHGFYLDFGMLPKKFIDDRFIKQEQKIRADDWNYFMLEEGIVDTDKLKLFFLNNKFQYVQLAELDKFGKIIDAFTKEDLFEDTPLQRGRSIDKIFNPRKIKGISIKNIRNVILNRLKVVDFESYNQMNKYVANCLIKQIPYSKKALDVNNFDFNGEYKNLLDSFHMHFNEKDVTIDPNFLKSLSLYVTQLRRMKHKMQLIEYKQLIFKIKQQQLFAQIISLSERLAMDRLNTKRTIVKRKKTVDKVLLTKNDTSDKQDVESDNNQEIKFKVTRFNDFSQFKQTAKQVRFTALSQVSPLFDMMNVLKMKSDDADSADSSTESNSENVSSSDGSLVIKKTTETKYRDRKSSIKKQTTRLEPREKNIKRAQPNREKKESNRKIINIKIKENKYKATNKYGKTHEIVSLPIKSKQKTSLPKADIIDTRRKTSISPAKVTQQRLNSLGDNIPNAVIVNDVVYDEKKDLQLVEPAAVLIQHSKLERVTKKSINIAEITETQVILTDETHEGLRELAKSSNSPEKTGTFVESRNENLIPSIEVFSNEELTIEVNGSENASQSHVSETQNQGNAFKELPQIVNQKEVTQNIEIQQKFIEHNHVINNKPLREEKNKQEILRNEEEQQEILDKETRNEANLNQFKGEESKSIAREELIGSEKNEQQYQNENKKLVLIKIQQEENKTSIIKNSQDYTSQTSVSNNDSKENLKKILIVPNIGDNEITKETKQFTKKLISTLKTLPKIRKRFKDRKNRTRKPKNEDLLIVDEDDETTIDTPTSDEANTLKLGDKTSNNKIVDKKRRKSIKKSQMKEVFDIYDKSSTSNDLSDNETNISTDSAENIFKSKSKSGYSTPESEDDSNFSIETISISSEILRRMNKIYIRPTPRYEPHVMQKSNLYLRTLMKFYDNQELKTDETRLGSKLVKKSSSSAVNDTFGDQERENFNYVGISDLNETLIFDETYLKDTFMKIWVDYITICKGMYKFKSEDFFINLRPLWYIDGVGTIQDQSFSQIRQKQKKKTNEVVYRNYKKLSLFFNAEN